MSRTESVPRTKRGKQSTIHASEQGLTAAELKERSVLRTLVRRNAGGIASVTVLSILNEAVQMSVPVLLGIIIDRGIAKGDLTFTVWATLGVIALRLLAAWAWASSFWRSMQMIVQERHNLRLAVTVAALDPASRPIERPAGEVLSVATSDADRAPDIFDMIAWALPAAAAVIGAGVWLAFINPWIGLAVFVGLALQVVALRVITPILSQKYDAQQSGAADAAATATDLVHGLRVLQGLGVQSRARRVYRARSRTALDAALVNSRYSGLSNGLMTLVSTTMIAAVTLIAGALTLNGTLSLGILISVVGLVRNMSGMMDGLSGVPVWFASFSTSARRVRHLLSELGTSLSDPRLAHSVNANAVGLRPDGSFGPLAPGGVTSTTRPTGRLPGVGGISHPIIGRVSDGEVVAVVPSSSVDAAAVLESVNKIPLDREQLLVEPHAVDLFDGTLREQLATRAAVTGDDDAWAHDALEAAGATDLLGILPEGLDTRIIDRGANLSGGQRQRLALARAVAADAPVLITHDPTTAVDAVTEQRIAEAFIAARSTHDRITIIVTKAPALLDAAHRVVFVGDREVIASGAHHELLTNNRYAKVVQR